MHFNKPDYFQYKLNHIKECEQLSDIKLSVILLICK